MSLVTLSLSLPPSLLFFVLPVLRVHGPVAHDAAKCSRQYKDPFRSRARDATAQHGCFLKQYSIIFLSTNKKCNQENTREGSAYIVK